MSGPAWIFLAAWASTMILLTIACVGDVNLAERLRAANKRNEQQRREFGRKVSAWARREAMLLDDLDFACAEAVRLRERLDVLESRGLPDLAEMRAGGAV